MKNVIISSLFVIFLAGCNSTAETSANTSDNNLTKNDINGLAQKTEFSAAEISAAVKKLGLKCSLKKVTGSRISKKTCSSKQQRLAREQAKKNLTHRQRMKETPGQSTLPVGY